MARGSMHSIPSSLSVSFSPLTRDSMRSTCGGRSCRYHVLVYPISGRAWASFIIVVKILPSTGPRVPDAWSKKADGPQSKACMRNSPRGSDGETRRPVPSTSR